jgi:hypothetical protein
LWLVVGAGSELDKFEYACQAVANITAFGMGLPMPAAVTSAKAYLSCEAA